MLTSEYSEVLAEYSRAQAIEDGVPVDVSKMAEYMGIAAWANGEGQFPRYRFLACYPVTGGNEGHYIHVDVLKDGRHIPNSASAVAAACAKHLGA